MPSSIISALQLSISNFVPFFKRHSKMMVVIILFFVLMEEWNLKLLQLTAAQGQEGLLIRIAIALNSSLLGLCFALLVPVAIHFREMTSMQMIKLIGAKTLPLTIEGLRAMIYIILGYLLIIPGLYFQTVFTFVFFVVLFNPEYGKNTSIDALKLSKTLAKGVFLPLLFLLLLSFAVELAMTFWGGKSSMLTNPADATLLLAIRVIANYFFPAMFYGLYVYKRGQ